MAIVTMNEFTLLAFHEHKAPLLKELQKFGGAQFRDLQQSDREGMEFLQADVSPERLQRCEAELERVKFALSRIAPYAAKGKLTDRQPVMDFSDFDSYLEHYDYGSVCDKVKQLDEKLNALKAEQARLAAENAILEQWRALDLPPGDLHALETVQGLIGTINKKAAEAFLLSLGEQIPLSYVESLGWIKDDEALLILVPAESYDTLLELGKESGFARTTLNIDGAPSAVVEQNLRRIGELEAEQDSTLESLRTRGAAYNQLLIVQDYYATLLEREQARANFLAMDTVVVMEGWVPEESAGYLLDAVERICMDKYHLELREVERDDAEVPVKLKNNRVVRSFEDITSMYATPRYNEIDPTPLLTPFYWLFFGLMVGDAGYGLLMLLATGAALLFLDLKKMRSFVTFFFYLSFAVIVGGFLYGSAFGVSFFKPVPAVIDGQPGYKPILDAQNATDIQVMLVGSIALGLIHLVYGLLIKGYMLIRDGKVLDAVWDSLLWITVLFGSIAWILGVAGFLSGGIGAVGKWVFIVSVILLALTQGRSSPSIGGKIGNGLYGVYGLTSYVGDLVSYTRIVALALSGAYIAYSFNLMAGLIPAGFLRILFGFIIFILGQSLNLGLALLGAYVHTCRLQYVEFFGKFYEGGGKRYTPFALKHESIQIK